MGLIVVPVAGSVHQSTEATDSIPRRTEPGPVGAQQQCSSSISDVFSNNESSEYLFDLRFVRGAGEEIWTFLIVFRYLYRLVLSLVSFTCNNDVRMCLCLKSNSRPVEGVLEDDVFLDCNLMNGNGDVDNENDNFDLWPLDEAVQAEDANNNFNNDRSLSVTNRDNTGAADEVPISSDDFYREGGQCAVLKDHTCHWAWYQLRGSK